MPTARGGLASTVLNNKIYVFGGEAPSGTFKENESYDPSSNSWKKEEPMLNGRHGLGAVPVGGSVYVLGGGKRPGLSVSGLNEVFTPKTTTI